MLRLAFAVLGQIWPTLAVRIGVRLFCRPPRFRVGSTQRSLLKKAEHLRVRVRGGWARIHRFAGAGPRILLMHGWGGQAAQLMGFATRLKASGAEVVLLDAPGHGASEGRQSTLLHFAEAIAGAAAAVGPPDGAIAHSMGATALVRAMAGGLSIGRVALLAPMPDPLRTLPRFCRFIGLHPRLARKMALLIERRFGVRVGQSAVHDVIARVDAGTKWLIVHDADDTQVSAQDIDRIAAVRPEGIRRLDTRGLGHVRGLADATVNDKVCAFVLGT